MVASLNLPPDAIPDSNRYLYFVAAGLAEHRFPTYFVTRPLFEAIARTSPPPEMRWQDIPWPFPALLFMLPVRCLVDPTGSDCPYVAVSFHKANESMRFPLPGCPAVALKDDTVIACTSAPSQSGLPIYQSVLNAITTPLLGDVGQITAGEAVGIGQDGAPVFTALAPNDAEFISTVMGLALNLVLAMTSRPELVTAGQPTGKTTQSGQAFWTPNFLGRSYRVRIEGGGTHAAPRMHWRRGHYRQQPHGPERQQRKTIWIEPTLVAGGTH